jgi:hypothetical protein
LLGQTDAQFALQRTHNVLGLGLACCDQHVLDDVAFLLHRRMTMLTGNGTQLLVDIANIQWLRRKHGALRRARLGSDIAQITTILGIRTNMSQRSTCGLADGLDQDSIANTKFKTL